MLQRQQPDLVLLAGGVAALGAEVEQAVQALGFTTRRFAGAGRTETASLIAGYPTELGVGRPLVTGGTVLGDATLRGRLTVDELAGAGSGEPGETGPQGPEGPQGEPGPAVLRDPPEDNTLSTLDLKVAHCASAFCTPHFRWR